MRAAMLLATGLALAACAAPPAAPPASPPIAAPSPLASQPALDPIVEPITAFADVVAPETARVRQPVPVVLKAIEVDSGHEASAITASVDEATRVVTFTGTLTRYPGRTVSPAVSLPERGVLLYFQRAGTYVLRVPITPAFLGAGANPRLAAFFNEDERLGQRTKTLDLPLVVTD